MTDFAAMKESERQVAAEVAAAWGCVPVEGDSFSPIDWLLIRDRRLRAVAEFKDRTIRRNYTSTEIDPFLINLDKVLSLRAAGDLFQVPALIISKCADGIFYFDVRAMETVTGSCVNHGRRDRDPARFPNDYGRRVMIPVAKCEKLEVTK